GGFGHRDAAASAALEEHAEQRGVDRIVLHHDDVLHAASASCSGGRSPSCWTCRFQSIRWARSDGLSWTLVFEITSITRPSSSSRFSSALRGSGQLVSTSTGTLVAVPVRVMSRSTS